jgi:hypothetical protein
LVPFVKIVRISKVMTDIDEKVNKQAITLDCLRQKPRQSFLHSFIHSFLCVLLARKCLYQPAELAYKLKCSKKVESR